RYGPTGSLPEKALAASVPGAAARGGEPNLFLARSSDLPLHHRPVRNEVPSIHDFAIRSGGKPVTRRCSGSGVHFPRREELSGLLRQRGDAANRRGVVCGWRRALALIAIC